MQAGKYIEKNQIGLIFVRNAEECAKDDNGRFEDDLWIVGTNLHMCDFEGTSKANGQTLTAEAENGVPGDEICRLSINNTGAGAVKVETSSCRNFCGHNVSLDINKAVRSQP